MPFPTQCNYAPPGEYIKDHTLVHHQGWWHLYSISGTKGYCHLYNGNEETISWSISKNLVDWEFRGHVLHASLRKGEFDQHEVWAPYCIAANNRFYMFYTGVQHPTRPMCYEKLGHHVQNAVWEGHKETIGLAISEDLTAWEKVADRNIGINIPGRDPHVVYDAANKRWLLYSTGGVVNGICEEYVSTSQDLINWEFVGVCARFPQDGFQYSTTESMTAMKHPLNGKWILIGNWHYALSDNPLDFTKSDVHRLHGYNNNSLGFAGEIIEWNGRWYRSGVMGVMDYWTLGFHEIEWEPNGAFRIQKASNIKVF